MKAIIGLVGATMMLAGFALANEREIAEPTRIVVGDLRDRAALDGILPQQARQLRIETPQSQAPEQPARVVRQVGPSFFPDD